MSTRAFDLPGARLAARVDGTGPGVFLVHGFPLNRTMWDPVVEAFEGRTVVAPDLRGFGESEVPTTGYSMASYVEDLVALMDALGMGQVVFCGLSMGGYVAFEMLRRHPLRVSALILIDTHPFADDEEKKAARNEQRATILRDGVSILVDQMLPLLVAPRVFEENGRVVQLLREMIASSNPVGMAGALEAMRDRPDSSPMLSSIDIPTLVVAGVEDRIVSLEQARQYADMIPNGELVEIKDAGHMAPMERPGETAGAIRELLSRISKGGAAADNQLGR